MAPSLASALALGQDLAVGGDATAPLTGWANRRAGTGLEFVWGEADDGLYPAGLFYRASPGFRIGAQGSFDPGSSDLRAVVAFKLDF